MLASTNTESSEIQITGSAGKISKSDSVSDWYLSLNENLVGHFPIKFTSNEKNNFKIISCEKDMVIIQNLETDDVEKGTLWLFDIERSMVEKLLI